MLNLIVKDILIQKKQSRFVIVYFLLLTLVFQNFSLAVLTHFWASIVIVYTLTSNATRYDEKSALVLNSLPVTRKEIVLAKYCSVFVYAVAVLLAIALLGGIVPGLGLHIAVRPLTIGDIAGVLAGTILFCSYHCPLYFKFGSNIKTTFVNMVAVLFLFFAPGILVDLGKSHPYRVVRFLSAIKQVPIWQLESATTLVLLAILLVSLLISLRVYESRDF